MIEESVDVLHRKCHIVEFTCKICKENHSVHECDEFHKMSLHERWNLAMTHRLCYCCLGDNHIGRYCRNARVCGLDSCKNTHHRLLHRDASGQHRVRSITDAVSEGLRHRIDDSMDCAVRLRTVPVVLKSRNNRVKINALLDDATSRSYVNARVEELGLSGYLSNVRVGVLNDTIVNIDTNHVEVGLESVDGAVDIRLHVDAVDRVTGDMNVTDWNYHSRRWSHLKNIQLPHSRYFSDTIGP